MTIDWIHFTPVTALAGGVIIGIATAAFVLLLGRIAGISGIVGGLLRPLRGDVGWRVAFIVGMVAAPFAYALFAARPPIEIAASYPVLIGAGLLVGIGTRYGAGCTSGHGVCGISRRSGRSLAATATFMAAGFVVVFITRHLLGGVS
jgi:uncharacterized membrane protein YedE/YeeE